MVTQDNFEAALRLADTQTPDDFCLDNYIEKSALTDNAKLEATAISPLISEMHSNDQLFFAAIAACWLSGFQRGFLVAKDVAEEW